MNDILKWLYIGLTSHWATETHRDKLFASPNAYQVGLDFTNMKSSNRLRGRISSWIQLGKSSRALVVSTRKKNARLHRLLGGVKHGTSLGMGVGWSSRFCTSRINVLSRKRNQQHNHARGHNQPWEPATTAECELVYTPASDQISLLTASQFLLTNIHVRSKEAPRRTDKNRPIQTWTQCPGYRFQDSYRKSFATRHQQLTVHPLGTKMIVWEPSAKVKPVSCGYSIWVWVTLDNFQQANTCGKIPKLDGYGSIPINTIFNGMTIHLPAILMFTRGTRVLTHCHMMLSEFGMFQPAILILHTLRFWPLALACATAPEGCKMTIWGGP